MRYRPWNKEILIRKFVSVHFTFRTLSGGWSKWYLFYRAVKSASHRFFHWIFKHFLSFFIYWWKYFPSCSITHSSLLIHVSKKVIRVSCPISLKMWQLGFLSSAGQGCRIWWVFAWYNRRGRSRLVRGPGCKPGAISTRSLLREDIQWIALHYTDVHCPGGCINFSVIFFGNVKWFRQTNLIRPYHKKTLN
jgi:hypothetical protein